MRTCYLSVGLVASAFTASMAWSAESEERLREILAQWKRASEANCTYHAKGTRFIYDRAFEIETRAAFEIACDETDRWVIRTEPISIDRTEISKKLGRQGIPYELRTGEDEIWFCDGQVFRWLFPRDILRPNSLSEVDRNRHEFQCEIRMCAGYSEVDISESAPAPAATGQLHFSHVYRDTNRFVDILLVDLKGLSTLLDNFDLAIERELECKVFLKAVPKSADVSRVCHSMKLIFDLQQSRLLAISVRDATQNVETVFVFSQTEFNRPFGDKSSPFHIPWSKFRQVDYLQRRSKTAAFAGIN